MKHGKITEALTMTCIVVAAAVLLHFGCRVLVSDSFVVNGVSMEPVFHSGDRVRVNKLLMGARIYTDYDFSGSTLSSFRLPGLSKVHAGDLVVANYPYARSEDTITFKINYVYLKRCYGAPGDTVRIVDGYYVNPETGKEIGDLTYQRMLSEIPDSVLEENGVVMKALQVNKSLGWTIRNFGPLYVPGKGDTVEIGIDSYRTWRRPVLFETGKRMVVRDGKVFLGDNAIDRYTFRGNWYFLGGDNVLNSHDSRYMGLFPESYLIGVVRRKSLHDRGK